MEQFSGDGYLHHENLPKNYLNIDLISTASNFDLPLILIAICHIVAFLEPLFAFLGAKPLCSLPVNLRAIPSAKRLLRKNYLNCF